MHVRDLHVRSGTVNQHRSPDAVSDGIRSVDDLDFVRRAQDHVAVLGFELPEIAGEGSHFAKHSRLYQTLGGNAVGVSLTPLRRRKRARRTQAHPVVWRRIAPTAIENSLWASIWPSPMRKCPAPVSPRSSSPRNCPNSTSCRVG